MSRSGDYHVARVGLSLLSQLGLERFVADDDEGLVRIATELATDRGASELANLRPQLRERMVGSSLCDAALTTKQIEQHYRAAWLEVCASGGGGRPG